MDMTGAVLSLGFGIKWQGKYLAGDAGVWGDRAAARVFESREAAEAFRDAEGLLPGRFDGVRVVELFEEVR